MAALMENLFLTAFNHSARYRKNEIQSVPFFLKSKLSLQFFSSFFFVYNWTNILMLGVIALPFAFPILAQFFPLLVISGGKPVTVSFNWNHWSIPRFASFIWLLDLWVILKNVDFGFRLIPKICDSRYHHSVGWTIQHFPFSQTMKTFEVILCGKFTVNCIACDKNQDIFADVGRLLLRSTCSLNTAGSHICMELARNHHTTVWYCCIWSTNDTELLIGRNWGEVVPGVPSLLLPDCSKSRCRTVGMAVE
jgi:hypothetical protein